MSPGLSAQRVSERDRFVKFPAATYVFVPKTFKAETFKEFSHFYKSIEPDPKRVEQVTRDCLYLYQHAHDTSTNVKDFALHYRSLIKKGFETSAPSPNTRSVAQEDLTLLRQWTSQLAEQVPIYVLRLRGQVYLDRPISPRDAMSLIGKTNSPVGTLICMPGKKVLTSIKEKAKTAPAVEQDDMLSNNSFPSQESWSTGDPREAIKNAGWCSVVAGGISVAAAIYTISSASFTFNGGVILGVKPLLGTIAAGVVSFVCFKWWQHEKKKVGEYPNRDFDNFR